MINTEGQWSIQRSSRWAINNLLHSLQPLSGSLRLVVAPTRLWEVKHYQLSNQVCTEPSPNSNPFLSMDNDLIHMWLCIVQSINLSIISTERRLQQCIWIGHWPLYFRKVSIKIGISQEYSLNKGGGSTGLGYIPKNIFFCTPSLTRNKLEELPEMQKAINLVNQFVLFFPKYCYFWPKRGCGADFRHFAHFFFSFLG